MNPHFLPRTALAASLSLLFAAPAWAQTEPSAEAMEIKDLGDVPIGYTGKVWAFSADNKLAAGAMSNPQGKRRATIWSGKDWNDKTELGAWEERKLEYSSVLALSADGKTAAGLADDGNGSERAVIWSGKNWQDKTDLGTLKTDNSGNARANALSADGKTAAGMAHHEGSSHNGDYRAVVWSGENWQRKTDLGTLKSDNSGNATANALSADGKTAAGGADSDIGDDFRAVVWSGENWQQKTDLGTLKTDNSGLAEVRALSADGKIAAGRSHNDYGEERAVIWSGDSWQHKTDLGTLKSDNRGNAKVYALSADGKVAAGRTHADNPSNQAAAPHDTPDRAIIWFGENWQHKADLNTLRADKTGYSQVNALSADGTVAGGWAVNEQNQRRVVLWRIRYRDATPPVTPTPQPPVTPTPQPPVTPTPQPPVVPTPPQPPVAPAPAPTPPVKVTPIDVENTHESIALLGRDTLQTLNLQHAALQRLHHGCGFDGADASAKMCYRTEADVGTGGGTRDAALGMSLGYRFGKGFAARLSFDRSLSRRLPESYRNGGNGNHGFALHGEWRGENWFARASGAWNDYRVRAVRPRLANTEAGAGDSRMRGQSYRLIAGQDFRSDERRFGWYLGAEHGRVARKGYTETNAEFPVTYADANVRHNGLLFGWQGELAFSPKLSLLWDGDVMQPVKAKAAEYRAKGEYLGAFVLKGERPRTRIISSLGLQYRVSPALTVGVRPYWLHGTDGKHRGGVRAGLYGTF